MLTLIEVNRRISLVDNVSNELERIECYNIIGKDILETINQDAVDHINTQILEIKKNYKQMNHLRSLLD